ncbi:MAG: SEC-C metal-binding domain-containing protein [Candidatus Limivivens sp.]|nr:SEC-C metal-binding domain-containing protein [Candidatus Limivivens sp.]
MKAYQLKMTIKDSHPPIWRRLVVPAGLSFSQLSVVLNEAMGWCGYHLFSFEFSRLNLRIEELEDEDDPWDDFDMLEASDTCIDDYLDDEKWFAYEYDFGDSWIHRVDVEKVIPDYERNYPLVLKAKGDCPWEDCGGIWGYYEMLDILKDPENPEHASVKEWTEGHFTRPLDVAKINESMKAFALGKKKKKPMSQSEIYESLEKEGKGFYQIRAEKRQSEGSRQRIEQFAELLQNPEFYQKIEELQKKNRQSDTLETIFSCYRKEDITEIAHAHGLAGFSGLNKERLIQFVRGRILDPDMMRKYLVYMTEREIRVFREMVQRGGTGRPENPADFDYVGSGGYVGFHSMNEIVIPEEVCRVFLQVDTGEFEEERKRTRKILNYLNAAAGLYGVCHVNVAVNLYQTEEQDSLDGDEVLRMIQNMPKSRRNFEMEDNRIFLKELEEDGVYRMFQKMQRDAAYYTPDRELVQFLGENDFLPFDGSMDRLQKLLAALPNENDLSAWQLCREIQYHARMGSDYEDVLDFFEEAGIEVRGKKADAFLSCLMEVWDHTRMILYRGHTPLEMAGRKAGKGEDGPGEKIVSFEQRRKRKIYPNDLCPCGSGKKYKHCCGRKNTEN